MPLFKQVKLTTPESIELELTLAGIGSRAYALMIDYLILWLGIALAWILWTVFATQLLAYLESLGINYSDVPLWLLSIALLVSFAVYAGYFVYFEVVWQGQTPGKRIAKIRVIQDNGKPVGLPQAALRALLRPIDDLLFLGVFFIFFGQREKRIGDWVAGTLVVQEERPQVDAKLAISDKARQLAAQLVDQMVDQTHFSQLLPDDFAVISDYLHRRHFMTASAQTNLSLKLAREIRAIIQLAEIPAGLTSDQFLEAVYLAYQQQFPG